uniref:Transmembrane protein 131 n=1 Tax=Equus asinus asinus TaxID=83772 RepID=A0A8C4KTX3_EQUAS
YFLYFLIELTGSFEAYILVNYSGDGNKCLTSVWGNIYFEELLLMLFYFFTYSISLYRGNCRPIRFEPPMLDFHEQPVGMPKMEKVYLHNPSSEETITLVSISATTSHFHASFFQNRKILPGGNTSFDVVFLARVVGNVENTLFINTSNHGVFTYQVFGVGVPNPYRLRPFLGARVPVNSSFSPIINIHNPHSEPLQVVEMYSSGGDLHLELPTGQQGGTRKLWEIPPYETKGVMRASFSSREADNHTAFIRIKTNASDSTEFIILPVEVEVTTAPGIYSSTEMLDFGTLRTQDLPKVLNLHLLNSGTKDVPITSVRPTPQNDAITVHFKPITLKASESKYTKVASISFDDRFTIRFYITALVDFFVNYSPADAVERPIYLTNTFSFAILIHDVLLPEEAKTMFKVHNFSKPVLILPNESEYIFTLFFMPSTSSMHIDNNILLITNASKFHLPVRVYTGFLDYFVLPPKIEERFIDFGILSATEASNILFAIINSNPIELAIKSWHIIGDGLSIELVATEKGNRTTIISMSCQLQNSRMIFFKYVILASGYFAVFRVKLTAKKLEGIHDGAIQITTDYEILTIPVKAVIAVGSLTCFPKHMVLPPSFPGKIVHQSLNIMNSFSQKVKIQQIRSLSEDVRFYYKRLRGNKEDLEPGKKSKIANIYFDPGLQCGDHCYVGLPFLSKSEPKVQPGVAMQEDAWDIDWDLHQSLFKGWMGIKENSGHRLNAVFEVNTDLQKNILSKITAELSWPSILSSPRHLRFPLTNTNCSSEEEITLENPADVPIYIQFIPLALYSNPSVFVDKLISRFNLSKVAKIDLRTLEFQVFRNCAHPLQSSTGFTEGLSQHLILNLILKPGEKKSVKVKFTPVHNRTVSSLIIIRNNLTVMDAVMVQGQGTTESLRVAGKLPGPGSSLRFKITEALLKDCLKLREPNFTLKRTFKVENTGQLQIHIENIEVSGYSCEGYGFKVVNCQEFALSANASKDIIILFTPDFTASRVIRELKFITTSGSEFVFVLNASLPYHMLATCAEALPRPNWELALYIIISGIMSALFLLVIGTAYLEAQGIWEPFRRRLSFEASNPPFDVGRPFDLRRIVGISSEGKYVHVLEINALEYVDLAWKGKPLQRKVKPPKKQEEKEKKGKGKSQEDELKDSLADDDSSSTTTETSNPDTEPLLKEVGRLVEIDVKERNCPPSATFLSHFCAGTNKLVDNRPPALAKFLPNSQELGNTSSSEGEKDSPPPEWDSVPVHKPGSSTDSLYKLSLQTLNADIFLKQRQTSPTPASPSPPAAPCPFTARGSYSSIVNSSDPKTKQPNGSKHRLTKAASLPGKNGNPTFAAVAAGYDKSPGSVSTNIIHFCVAFSSCNTSSGLWSPVSNPSSPDFTPLNSFSAFGNSFNLTGGECLTLALSLMSCGHRRKAGKSILGSTSGLWSTTPFSSSIWSSNLNSALPFATPANTLTSIGLMGTENSSAPPAPSTSSPADDLRQTYNPWQIWSPAIGRRSSDPWSNTHFPHEN